MNHHVAIAILTVLAAGPFLAVARSSGETEANKETVRRMVYAINVRDFDALDELLAPNVRRHSAATPGVTVENLDQFKAFLRQDLAAVPDAQQEIAFLLAENDRVALYATYRGTQDGQFGPFPPSHKPFTLPFLAILRLEHGKIAEMWIEWDNLSVLTQLGHFPPKISP
jgi:predicted ester cyclase